MKLVTQQMCHKPLKNIIMKRLFSNVTKQSFYGVTKLMADCSYEATFLSFLALKTRVSLGWHTDAKETKCSYYFLC